MSNSGRSRNADSIRILIIFTNHSNCPGQFLNFICKIVHIRSKLYQSAFNILQHFHHKGKYGCLV